MGAIHWTRGNLINTILDVVVIKTRLVIREEDLIAILREEFPEDSNFMNTDEQFLKEAVRTRSEEFDYYCWHVRKRLGELEDVNPSFVQDIDKMMKWHELGYDPIQVHQKLFEFISELHDDVNPTIIDPTPAVAKAIKENIGPPELIMDTLKNMFHNQTRSNVISPVEEKIWDGGISLETLFEREAIPKRESDFIDQELVNYLQANPNKLEYMHWRNFERLAAEFYNRKGYEVHLGPGSNDGGVDIRVFNKTDSMTPYIIIQCKRHKSSNEVKIETVKSFYADVQFEGAKKGLIATTSRIATGGKKVVSIRNYPLEFAENKEIKGWIEEMKHRFR